MRKHPFATLTALSLGFLISCSGGPLVTGPSPTDHATELLVYSPKFEFLEMAIGSAQANVVMCFDLPSDKDWVLGRLHGDVYLSSMEQIIPMRSFTLHSLEPASVGRSARRCDNLLFDLPAEFEAKGSTITIERIAASLPANPDWDQLLRCLLEEAPGIVIEPMRDEGGLSFTLVDKPPGMSDIEAHDIVVGLAEPVVIGPWRLPVDFNLK